MVVDTAKSATEGTSWKIGSKEYCVLVTLDVKNAFNTANWEKIVNALTQLNIPKYLLAIIKDYFRSRVLIYDTNEGLKHHVVTGGVPQGSVLGPLLWNIMYDGVLRLCLPEKAKIIGFADDIAIVVAAKMIEEAKTVAECSVQIVRSWLNSMGLSLAEHKTEVVLITSRKVVEYVNLKIGSCDIRSKDCLKYLGVIIDNRLSFKQHLDYVRDKAINISTALCRLMPNKKGPSYLRRQMLAGVVKSVILYAAPIWADATKLKTYGKKLSSVYRLSALRVCCAYRTVSDDAALVISGLIPIDILAREAKFKYEQQPLLGSQADINAPRNVSMEEWQTRWTNSIKGRWTYKLIPNIMVWYGRQHGNLNYYLSQFLTGHGCFRSYLYRFGLDTSPLCPFCVEQVENSEHVFFHCIRFTLHKENLEIQVQRNICVDNIIEIMLISQSNWDNVCEYIKTILLELRRQDEIRRNTLN